MKQAVDRANGCERQVKTRTKNSKKSTCRKQPEVAQCGENQSGEGGPSSQHAATQSGGAHTEHGHMSLKVDIALIGRECLKGLNVVESGKLQIRVLMLVHILIKMEYMRAVKEGW